MILLGIMLLSVEMILAKQVNINKLKESKIYNIKVPFEPQQFLQGFAGLPDGQDTGKNDFIIQSFIQNLKKIEVSENSENIQRPSFEFNTNTTGEISTTARTVSTTANKGMESTTVTMPTPITVEAVAEEVVTQDNYQETPPPSLKALTLLTSQDKLEAVSNSLHQTKNSPQKLTNKKSSNPLQLLRLPASTTFLLPGASHLSLPPPPSLPLLYYYRQGAGGRAGWHY